MATSILKATITNGLDTSKRGVLLAQDGRKDRSLSRRDLPSQDSQPRLAYCHVGSLDGSDGEQRHTVTSFDGRVERKTDHTNSDSFITAIRRRNICFRVPLVLPRLCRAPRTLTAAAFAARSPVYLYIERRRLRRVHPVQP